MVAMGDSSSVWWTFIESADLSSSLNPIPNMTHGLSEYMYIHLFPFRSFCGVYCDWEVHVPPHIFSSVAHLEISPALLKISPALLKSLPVHLEIVSDRLTIKPPHSYNLAINLNNSVAHQFPMCSPQIIGWSDLNLSLSTHRRGHSL